jgi:hypothetical protein
MVKTFSVLLFAVLTTAASAVAPESKYQPPRTKDGRPDFQGVWNFASGVPLQRPAKFADRKVFTKEEFDKQREALQNLLRTIAKFMPIQDVGLDWIDNKLYVDDLRTSLITYPENGRLPDLVEGVTRAPGVEEILAALENAGNGPPAAFGNLLAAAFGAAKKDSHADFTKGERCLGSIGVPIVPQFGDDNYVQIIQGSDSVALVMDGGRRIISLDGKSSTSNKLRVSTGISRGHWEGDTLVVETRSFRADTSGFAGAGNSRDKVVTERLARTAAGLEYSATVVDPSSFKDRIELSFPMARVDAHIYEATCHEGNYSLPNVLSAVRHDELANTAR